MISELLEETGIDRAKLRAARRQILEGVVLLCQWQLERMREHEPAPGRKRAQKVAVE
jgi:hypothetical protein